MEMPQRDRQYRGLRGGAHRERAENGVAGLGSEDDPRGRRERELESWVEEVPWAKRENQKRRGRETVQHVGVAIEQDGREHEHGHDDRTQNGRLRAHDGAERENAHAGRGRTAPAAESDQPRDEEHRGRHQRDVEARHGEDVIDAGAPEAVVDLRR